MVFCLLKYGISGFLVKVCQVHIVMYALLLNKNNQFQIKWMFLSLSPPIGKRNSWEKQVLYDDTLKSPVCEQKSTVTKFVANWRHYHYSMVQKSNIENHLPHKTIVSSICFYPFTVLYLVCHKLNIRQEWNQLSWKLLFSPHTFVLLVFF